MSPLWLSSSVTGPDEWRLVLMQSCHTARISSYPQSSSPLLPLLPLLPSTSSPLRFCDPQATMQNFNLSKILGSNGNVKILKQNFSTFFHNGFSISHKMGYVRPIHLFKCNTAAKHLSRHTNEFNWRLCQNSSSSYLPFSNTRVKVTYQQICKPFPMKDFNNTK